MPLASMTGFARTEGTHGLYTWVWEIRSVNGKGLDLRLRLPQSVDALEADFRKEVATRLKRGNVSLNLQMQKDQGEVNLVVNEKALAQIMEAAAKIRAYLPDAPQPTIDAILAQKGILEPAEVEESEVEKQALHAAIKDTFSTALEGLISMRRSEGAAITTVLEGQLDTIERLAKAAEAAPSRQPEAIKARLQNQLDALLEAGGSKLDPHRLHQELALLATKADIREELDRLFAHVAAAREMLASNRAIGRRLDFLSQEFNREANTLCSKSNSVELTAIGLELKTVIDQLREQIQNIE
ncbi:YicC/YloC family endoribonuclease [Polycladidibacter hongkongensis]|uniref:YicC/YloC family endoribonuclease n=1 Tax=Polycladidibacter hongkongensis TaxID=1647556 RepID=UPI00082C711D|nr:YicC/YloC family endoribonuclease [Pseudovibrio hongkongensis]